MDPDLPLWMNMVRFISMFLGAVLLGLMYRWTVIERRKCFRGLAIGVTILTVENIVDHYLRLGTPVTWRVPANLVAFSILCASITAMTNRERRARKPKEK